MPRGRRRIYANDQEATRAWVQQYWERQQVEGQEIPVPSQQQASPSPQLGPFFLIWDPREQPDPVLSSSAANIFGHLQETLEAIPIP